MLYTYDGCNEPIGLLTGFESTAYIYTFGPYGTGECSSLVTDLSGAALPWNANLAPLLSRTDGLAERVLSAAAHHLLRVLLYLFRQAE